MPEIDIKIVFDPGAPVIVWAAGEPVACVAAGSYLHEWAIAQGFTFTEVLGEWNRAAKGPVNPLTRQDKSNS